MDSVKIGDLVICIRDDSDIIKGRLYRVDNVYLGAYVQIEGLSLWCSFYYFEKLRNVRKEKLNKIKSLVVW